MTTAKQRRFTLRDAMILVAATAVGLAVERSLLLQEFAEEMQSEVEELRQSPQGWVNVLRLASGLLLRVTPCAATWSSALVLLRVLPPRPPRQRLWRQPGVVAGVSACTAFLFGAVGLLTVTVATLFNWKEASLRLFLIILLANGTALIGLVLASPGIAVAASWTNLVLSGGWRSEASWIDRLGRLLGLYWVVNLLLPLWLAILIQIYES